MSATRARRLLTITGGHRIDLDAFTAMLDAICADLGWVWTHATQPLAQRWLSPEHAGVWDAILLHDLPGLQLRRGAEPQPFGPDDDVRENVMALLSKGQGIVATHHALAGWPSWDAWADVLGGRFFYRPGRLHDEDWPASGYRMGTYRIDVASDAAKGHPVCEGVGPFTVDDELYLCAVHEHDVVPLLRTDADLSPASMIDTYGEVRDGVQAPAAVHRRTSQLVGWAKRAHRSPLVYLLPGHGPSTMADETYRRLLSNSIEWVASDDARSWAADDTV